MRPANHLLLPLFALLTLPAAAEPYAPAQGKQLASTPQPKLQPRAQFDRIHVQAQSAESIWVRGQQYRAHATPDGVAVLPVFGKQSPREFPVQFTLTGVQVGERPLVLDAAEVDHTGDALVLKRGSVTEVYHVDLDGLEQTFVFDALPARGQLQLEIQVASELTFGTEGDLFVWRHPDLGHVTYGEAFAVDAAGKRCAVTREWTGDSIRLTVPSDFVAQAELPLVVDPPINSFINSFGSGDASSPDVCWAVNSWWMCWQDFTSATASDVYVSAFDSSGIQGTTIAVDISSENWTDPRIAWSDQTEQLMIAARVDNGSQRQVRCQRVDPVTEVAVGSTLTLQLTFTDIRYVDIGGQQAGGLSLSSFCVVWAIEKGTGDWDVQYQVLDVNGADLSPTYTIDASTAMTDSQVTISNSRGDGFSSLNNTRWIMSWIRRDATPGSENLVGNVWVRDIGETGDPFASHGDIQVTQANLSLRPSVSSRMFDTLDFNSTKPAVLVYEELDFNLSGQGPLLFGTIYGNVLGLPDVFEQINISDTLEDIDPPTPKSLDRRNPSIASSGDGFFLTYDELYHGTAGLVDYDMYMASGHIVQTTNGATLALGERHQNMAFSNNAESGSRVATKPDSGITGRQAAAVWTRSPIAGGGPRVEGSTLEVAPELLLNFRAVGSQFCDALPNSRNSLFSDTNSGWMFLRGELPSPTTVIAYAVDLPTNQFGYLFASRTPADILMPGDSVGRLCMTGNGRYIDQVQSSGLDGRFETTVDPNAIITPTGPVAAAPGETWYFQYWHRDFVGGQFTSNFTNAVSVLFEF